MGDGGFNFPPACIECTTKCLMEMVSRSMENIDENTTPEEMNNTMNQMEDHDTMACFFGCAKDDPPCKFQDFPQQEPGEVDTPAEVEMDMDTYLEPFEGKCRDCQQVCYEKTTPSGEDNLDELTDAIKTMVELSVCSMCYMGIETNAGLYGVEIDSGMMGTVEGTCKSAFGIDFGKSDGKKDDKPKAKTIELNWLSGFADPNARTMTVNAGDSIEFQWNSGHNVYMMPNGHLDSCNFYGATQIGSGLTGPVSFTVPKQAKAGDMFYFACNVGGHCMAGQHLAVTVGGGATKPEYTCAKNGKNGKDCGETCCPKQSQYGLTCHWDGAVCADGEAPDDGYAECVMMDKMWKKGMEKKTKASDAEKCYKNCAKSKGFKNGKTCVAWSYNPDAKKGCMLFSKSKKSKSKNGVISGTNDCHPTKGKQ